MRRNLRQSSDLKAEEMWFRDMEQDRLMRVMLLDALEVKLVNDLDSDEETDVKSFEWDVASFDQDFIVLKIKFENPEDIGSFSSKDYITVTFWGIDFFKSY